MTQLSSFDKSQVSQGDKVFRDTHVPAPHKDSINRLSGVHFVSENLAVHMRQDPRFVEVKDEEAAELLALRDAK